MRSVRKGEGRRPGETTARGSSLQKWLGYTERSEEASRGDGRPRRGLLIIFVLWKGKE